MNPVMLGAVAMASSVASLFFLRFWRQTRDTLFSSVLPGICGQYGATRLALGLGNVSDEDEPLFYIARFVTFALIVIAIINKNRVGSSQR